MESFRTEIKPDCVVDKIEYDSKIMFLGSCFATNIGEKFKNARLNCMVNPYGVIYNPMSVANTLNAIVSNRIYYSEDLHFQGEHWHSFYHHSSFSDRDKEICLQKINENNLAAHDYLKSCQYLFITFGTAWVYQWVENEEIVSNCHKYPAKDFNRYILNVEEIVSTYKKLLTELLVFNPKLKIVFTVSPVRHLKDGAHGNQISKATLLLAVDSIVEQFASCDYFPAYELLLDDLRDYRFYDVDMVHPNSTSVDYIWRKLESCFFSAKTLDYIKEMHKLVNAIGHRPYDSSSESHQIFLNKQIEKINYLKNKYPEVDFGSDLSYFKSKII
ncbi:GSCFA domain-containing protein [Plebeiibacterium sediminum]|uniref:GSCFA domain-containing protein n=1 Tax=Plebeiibacterium sediminum TaxID=2992112 RepID=A0AAE3SFD6_9BACT|nr:GSCFA domain-containing protein [Plebeiobacterium sediminum]MCW3787171.1 GSCFA domain-containing protein [Plebeiobacterium sediminum]